MKLLYFAIIYLVYETAAQGCTGPNLTAGQKIICGNIQMWDENTEAVDVPLASDMLPQVGGSPTYALGAAISAAPIPATKYECMDWQCVCGYIPSAWWDGYYCVLPKGGYLSNLRRKEYRTLTKAEIQMYTAAFLAVKSDIYGYISTIHSDYLQSPGAHSGPAFLPWHRELLKRMEIGIRTAKVNGSYPFWKVTIPYWDSSMDADILNFLGISSTNSVMFSDELMGSVKRGVLTDGQFAGFSGRQGPTRRVLDQWPRETFLIQRKEIEDIMKNHDYNMMLGATAGPQRNPRICAKIPETNIELLHGLPHVWIGGNMQNTVTATNDPIFFCHHAFIDAIWEEWRMKKQTTSQRETQWNTGSTECYSQSHLKDALMVPFSGGYINTDGLSNKYTRNFYTYAPRLRCSTSIPCPGEYLWCNLPTGTCVAKVKVGSSCKLIRDVDPCYSSACVSGTCRPLLGSAPNIAEPPPIVYGAIEKDTQETCFNQHECCHTWATQKLCSSNSAVKVACPASCGTCRTKTKCKDTCTDRHPLCDKYASEGQCDKNPFFMAENCRKTCNKCGKTRAQSCKGTHNYQSSTQLEPPGRKPTGKLSKSLSKKRGSKVSKLKKMSGCYNSNLCCQHWKLNLGCSKMGILTNVCAASCLCTPKYDLMSCNDFLNNCDEVKRNGLCGLEQMKENCRETCGSCPTPEDIQLKCGTGH